MSFGFLFTGPFFPCLVIGAVERVGTGRHRLCSPELLAQSMRKGFSLEKRWGRQAQAALDREGFREDVSLAPVLEKWEEYDEAERKRIPESCRVKF